MPGHELCRARNPEDLRRHLDHAPLSRHPLRQRPPHVRLPLQALDQRADRDRRRNPQIHGRGDRGERSHPPHPLSPHHHLGEMVERDQSLDHRRHAHRHRRAPALHHEFLLDVPGLLPPLRGLHAGVEGHGGVQGPDRSSAAMARGSRLQGQARRRDRLRRHRRDADPGDGQGCGACDDAAALADLFPRRPQRDRDHRAASAVAGGRGVDPRDHAAEDPVRTGRLHPQDLRAARGGQEGFAVRRSKPISARTTTSRPTSRRATGHGASASPSFRTAICSWASSPARRPSSPTRSTASPKRASC